MPFNELQRRDSWPPTILRVHEDDDTLADIDENPFSYFLTPEDFDDDIEDLSAGIETLDVPKQQVRTVSPSSLQRVPVEDDDASFGVAMPLSLRDFTRAHSKRREEQGPARNERVRIIDVEPPSSSPRRGRAMVRLSPPRSRNGRGRGQTRSLSARRPQSWREPSPDIWSIEEESEGDGGENDKESDKQGGRNPEAGSSVNAATGAIPTPKPKKRVHWAF